ncbi:MAG: hypothetical protein A2W37_16415 [Chloroflexi bacterium RBG_16_63_12]|nr:MAG: hypothetical protein A2W37_16415 [Chloroflexi bacterium RBG_16_63_12]
MKHHTKDKGDIGIGMVIANLMNNGIQVCVPISEHLPFDLVAISAGFALRKVQVKYRSVRNGKISLSLRNSYSDRRGVHVRQAARSSFDAYAVYCPETQKVYYVNVAEIPDRLVNVFTLRVGRSKNNQIRGVNVAANFENPRRLFE